MTDVRAGSLLILRLQVRHTVLFFNYNIKSKAVLVKHWHTLYTRKHTETRNLILAT